MNKEEFHELLMGVAVAALAYAIWQHFKKPTNTTQEIGHMNDLANPYAQQVDQEMKLTIDQLTAGTIPAAYW